MVEKRGSERQETCPGPPSGGLKPSHLAQGHSTPGCLSSSLTARMKWLSLETDSEPSCEVSQVDTLPRGEGERGDALPEVLEPELSALQNGHSQGWRSHGEQICGILFLSRSQPEGHLVTEALDPSSKVGLGISASACLSPLEHFMELLQSFCSMVCVSLLDCMLPEGEASDCSTHSCGPVSGPLQTLTR